MWWRATSAIPHHPLRSEVLTTTVVLLLLLLTPLRVEMSLLLRVVLMLLLLLRPRPRSRGPLGSPRQNRIRLTAPTDSCRGPAAARLVRRPRLAAAALRALRGSGDHDTPRGAGRVCGHAE